MQRPSGWFTKFKGFLAGVDAEILARCPPRDHDNVSTIAWMLIGVWVWQTTVFALVTHLMLAQPGEIRPELIGAAMLLATLILLLDSYMVIRSSWYLSGLEELKRAGLRLQNLWSARVKNGVFLAIRILIAILLALLNGIFTGTLIFRKDIDGEIARAHQARLAPLVEAARQRVDGELQRNADPKHLGAKIGLTAVLHTWGSAMTHHPHMHIVVPGGGLSSDGARWIACRPGFFLPVRVLSRFFRRLFLDRLAEAHRAGRLAFHGELAPIADADAFAAHLAPLRRAEWVVYAKRPFAGPDAVLAYLLCYTHRVAIANSRLLALDDRGVTFRWKDYRARDGAKDNAWIKTLTLAPDEFIRRFLLHVLPNAARAAGIDRQSDAGGAHSSAQHRRSGATTTQRSSGTRVIHALPTRSPQSCPTL